MRYAKLINNYPQYAPRTLRIGDKVVFNPTGKMLVEAGYLPVIESEPPEVDELHYADPRYVERDGSIMQEWEVIELPPVPDEVTAEEALDIILGGAAT